MPFDTVLRAQPCVGICTNCQPGIGPDLRRLPDESGCLVESGSFVFLGQASKTQPKAAKYHDIPESFVRLYIMA
jgi:hypothetical protein